MGNNEHPDADKPMTKGEVIDLLATVLANTRRCSDCMQYIGMKCIRDKGCKASFKDFIWRQTR